MVGSGRWATIEDGCRHVDDVVELVSHFALGAEPVRPVDDGAVAGAAEVRRHLLRPLVGGAHGVGPAHGVVVVGLRRPELVDVGRHELGGLEGGRSVERKQLVERPVRRALGTRPVVADDVVHQRVIEDPELVERIDHPSDRVVGVLQKSGVDLHLAGEHRLEDVRHVFPGLDLGRASGEIGVGGYDSLFLLSGEDLLPQCVPSRIETAPVLVRPFRSDVMGGVSGSGGVIREEGFVSLQSPLLAEPGNRLVRHVVGQVVALCWRGRWLNGGRPFVQGRVVLVGLTSDEAIEIVEATSGGPQVEWSDGAGLPHRDLVALPELGGRVAVLLEDLCQRSGGLWSDGGVARSRSCCLGDRPHPHRVMVAAREQGRPRGGTQRRGVESAQLDAASGQSIRRGCVDRTPEGRGGPESNVVEQDDEYIGRSNRGPRLGDRWERGVGILGVIGRDADCLRIMDGQDEPVDFGG